MRPQGQFKGTALTSRFAEVALEYLAAPNKLQWEYAPRIITLRDPSDEKFLIESLDASERRFHMRNLLIEMRERIPEVITALQSRPGSVLPDTIQRLGLRGHFYHFGVQMRPNHVQSLESMPGMEHCTFRDIGIHDLAGTMRLRIAA